MTFKRETFKSLTSTLVADVKVTNVSAKFRTILLNQTGGSPIAEDDSLTQIEVAVGPEPKTIGPFKTFFFLKVYAPTELLIGGQSMMVNHQLLLQGALPEVVILAKEPGRVNLIGA